MCPVPIWAVALEKVCFQRDAEHRGGSDCVSAGHFIPAKPVYPHFRNWPLLVVVLVMSSLLAGALGWRSGTTREPKQIGLVFSIVVVPITFWDASTTRGPG